MGISLVLWRARVGLFYSSSSIRHSGSGQNYAEYPIEVKSILKIVLLAYILTSSFVLTLMFSPSLILLFCQIIGMVANLWVFVIFMYAIIKVSSNVYVFRSSPYCLLCCFCTPLIVSMFTPGFSEFLCNIFNPRLSRELLHLCGDIHTNPGPNAGLGLQVWFTNVNSLTAEGGKRFSDLNQRMCR